MKKLSLLLLVFVAQSITANVTEAEKQAYKDSTLQCYEQYFGIKTKKNGIKLTFPSTADLYNHFTNCLNNIDTNLSKDDCTKLHQEVFMKYNMNFFETVINEYKKIYEKNNIFHN